MSTEPILTLRGHTRQVRCVAFSSDGRRMVSGSDNKTVIIWDVVTGEAIGQPLQHNGDKSNWVMSVAFSPDNKRIVSSAYRTVWIWDALTGTVLGSPLSGHSDWGQCVAFSPDGQRVVSCSEDKTLRIWDGMTGEAIGSSLQGHTECVYSVAWFPDGKRIVSGSADMTLRIWDSMTGKEMGPPLEGHPNYVYCVAVSSDGRRIVSGSADNTLILWDAETGKVIGPPLQGHTDFVTSVAFSPDGTLIVSGSADKTIRMWDGLTGEAIGSPLQAHHDSIEGVAFSPDGNQIVSGAGDQTVKLWDLTAVEALNLTKLSHFTGFTIKVDDPSILANISDAVAQCKQGELNAAMQKFDLAIAVSSSSSKCVPSICPILAIKAIALFEAGNEDTGIARVGDLIRLIAKNAGYQMVKAYMLSNLSQKSYKHGQYDRTVALLSEAIGKSDFSHMMDIYYKYRTKIPADDGLALVTNLFGWEFENLRYTINQAFCEALRRIGRSQDALVAVVNMGKKLKEDEQDRYQHWSTAFKQDCVKEWSERGDQALKDSDYDAAIEQYSGSIVLDPSNYDLYSNRSSAYASKQLWKEALDDAERAIKLDPSHPTAYERRYHALHGAKQYDEAIVALRVFAGKSSTNAYDQYVELALISSHQVLTSAA